MTKYIPPFILAGDLGGTNFRIALFSSKKLECLFFKKFRSIEYQSLDEMIVDFLKSIDFQETIHAACFGVPGPNINGIVVASNLGWRIDIARLPSILGISHVSVLNDLEAMAHGLHTLTMNDYITIQSSNSTVGNRCLIAPGTGLGEAGLFWNGKTHVPWATEGGHSDFPPLDELQDELLCFLRKQYGRVSLERVISGMGIVNIYHFLRDTGRFLENDHVNREILNADMAAVIAKYAINKSCQLCELTMELFIKILGTEVASLALKTMSIGGIFLGGGIPPKIIHLLRQNIFLESFLNKGRQKNLLATMPIHVVLNDQTALFGSAKYALEQIQ